MSEIKAWTCSKFWVKFDDYKITLPEGEIYNSFYRNQEDNCLVIPLSSSWVKDYLKDCPSYTESGELTIGYEDQTLLRYSGSFEIQFGNGHLTAAEPLGLFEGHFIYE